MKNILDFEYKYFEISITSDHTLANELGKVFILAKNREDANKKVMEINPDEQAKFRDFKSKYDCLLDSALQVSDHAVENGFDLIDRESRVDCFYEALLRVYLSGIEDQGINFISYMIIVITSDIIAKRGSERLESEKK